MAAKPVFTDFCAALLCASSHFFWARPPRAPFSSAMLFAMRKRIHWTLKQVGLRGPELLHAVLRHIKIASPTPVAIVLLTLLVLQHICRAFCSSITSPGGRIFGYSQQSLWRARRDRMVGAMGNAEESLRGKAEERTAPLFFKAALPHPVRVTPSFFCEAPESCVAHCHTSSTVVLGLPVQSDCMDRLGTLCAVRARLLCLVSDLRLLCLDSVSTLVSWLGVCNCPSVRGISSCPASSFLPKMKGLSPWVSTFCPERCAFPGALLYLSPLLWRSAMEPPTACSRSFEF